MSTCMVNVNGLVALIVDMIKIVKVFHISEGNVNVFCIIHTDSYVRARTKMLAGVPRMTDK